MVDVLRVPPTPVLRQWSQAHGFSPELVARWGEFVPDLKGLVGALVRAPPTFLRVNGLRGEPRETIARLRERGFGLEPAGLPHAFRVTEAPFSPGATPEYLAGRYFLQDVSSQLAPLALDPRPGERVADLCAAPGGKTVAVADLMHNEGAIAAFEKDPARHRTLVANLSRCGVANAASWARPGQDAASLVEAFDQVLLDAPCTGEGVIQRDPSRKRGQLREYEECAREQNELVDVARQILRPGGVLVYATCTFAPEENELQVDRAVRELGFRLEELPATLREAKLEGHPLAPGLTRVASKDLVPELKMTRRVFPHVHGCLGFFVARLRKEGSP